MLKKIIVLISFVHILVCMESSFATTYSEDVSGDIENTDIGSLDLGINTVSGQFWEWAFEHQKASEDNPSHDLDTFRFTVAPEMKLDSIGFRFATTMTPSSSGEAWVRVKLTDDANNELGGCDKIDIVGSGYKETGFIGLPSGSYWFIHEWSHVSADYAFTSNYTIDLNTSSSPVPEPATILLLGFSLIGLAGVSRKKK